MTRSYWSAGKGLHRSLAAAGLLLCGVLALSACGGSSSASAPKMLPVLQKAQAALKDATGTFTFVSASKSLDVTGSGTCQLTITPQRSLEVMKLNGQSSTTIVDGPTTTYTKLPASAIPAGTQVQWLKGTSINAIVQGVSDVLDYAGYTKTTQKADATINGVVYIEVTGVEASGNTVDLYLNKVTYLPVKAVIQHSDATGVDITITFTKTNSKVAIVLPSADEVLSE